MLTFVNPFALFRLDIREIPMEMLKKHGIKAMAYDKDNCLTAPYAPTIHPPFKVSNYQLT
jgi:predicted HAD superfamily phosphohydrolase YqeG